MDPDRIKTIVEWPVPKSQHDIQVFLSFANFYRRFVERYSRVVLPITDLLRKSQKFLWTTLAQEAFDRLKTLFTTAPILKHFDPNLLITLHVDSSGAAISGIISRPHNGVLHSVAFWSRKCIEAKCNYDIHNRGMLAVVESMKHWRHYLEGAKYPIQIKSDHKNLEVFMTTKVLNRRQARWAEFLASYDFVLVHIKGTKNPADGPSRCPDYMENVELPTSALIPRSALRMPQPDTRSNPALENRVSRLEAHWNRIGVHANTTPDASLRSRFITALEKDPLATEYRDNPPKPWSWQDGLLLHDGLVYVPHDDALRVELMQMHHNDPLAGHYGVAKTLELLLRNYYFPNMPSYVKK
jgi:RNase H-like domain found in reverse transcriptase/Integrase zinc binding domain